jgi:hypothetical protein
MVIELAIEDFWDIVSKDIHTSITRDYEPLTPLLSNTFQVELLFCPSSGFYRKKVMASSISVRPPVPE